MVKEDRYQPLSKNDHIVLVLQAFNTHLPADGRATLIRHFRVYKQINKFTTCSPLLTVILHKAIGRESAGTTQHRIRE